MPETNVSGERSADTFADALAELKEQGSMLLLAGRGHDALAAACGQLLGEHGPERRRRLFVLTDRTTTHAPSVDPTRTIRYDLAVRSAAATAPPDDTDVVEGDLGDLQSAVADAVAAIDREAGGLDPAELRVCLDSADRLLAAHDRESLFRFLHALSGVVRDANAMCHVHLPVAFDDPETQLVAPLFDAVIETDREGRQRWHLREPELTTEWLSV